jgi:two-component system OmpR family response regulator
MVEQSPEQKRVLIVDDNREAAEMLQMLLEMQGYTVEVANAGPDGLARHARFVPHVICSDLNMPGMSGYEFARQVRAAGPAGRFLIAISGAADADPQAIHEAGFDQRLTKPFSLDDILGPIETFFAHRA